MIPHNPRANLLTHDVTNQPPPFVDINIYENDAALIGAVAANGGASHARHLSGFGERAGSAEILAWATAANKNTPQLKGFDPYGHRLDEVEFHPAYHMLMDLGLSAGIAGSAWTAKEAGHVRHAALLFMMTQADTGVCCPMSMTYAATATLRNEPDLAAIWVPRASANDYDARFIPPEKKRAVTIGMAMTEKQGGSDLRANTTRATQSGDGWVLTGHKWFCSAPMSDAFLTLAQTEEGITCFLVPRWKPDGQRNAIHLTRLKDKLGDRSNASAEIEYHGAFAWKLGQQGKGIQMIIDMVQHTRLDCIIGSAGGMRVMIANALWHSEHRKAFQRKIIDQPAMQNVLADLILESEAATALAFRIARAFDCAALDANEAAIARMATPIAKYWVCKRQPGFAHEALECHGGAGFVEEQVLARHYRAAPLNAVWEGSGNVIALDVVRAVTREPDSFEAIMVEIAAARGANAFYDSYAERLMRWLEPGALNEGTARAFTQDMARALCAAAMRDTVPDYVFDGYCQTRLSPDYDGSCYGATRGTLDTGALIARAAPF